MMNTHHGEVIVALIVLGPVSPPTTQQVICHSKYSALVLMILLLVGLYRDPLWWELYILLGKYQTMELLYTWSKAIFGDQRKGMVISLSFWSFRRSLKCESMLIGWLLVILCFYYHYWFYWLYINVWVMYELRNWY